MKTGGESSSGSGQCKADLTGRGVFYSHPSFWHQVETGDREGRCI